MRLGLAFVALAACYRPELELTSSTRQVRSPTNSGDIMQHGLAKDGARVRASGPRPDSPDRWGTLTEEGVRRLDAALACLEDNWDPTYELVALSSPTYTHRLLRDGWDVEVVIHEPSFGRDTEVLPLSELTFAIELETIGCGGQLVVVDEPAPECAP